MAEIATSVSEVSPGGGTSGDGHASPDPICVTDPGNPVCARRVIAVGKLIAHPGNVREDLA